MSNDECYLNHAAQAKMSKKVLSIGKSVLEKRPWELDADEDQKEVRRLFADLVNASADEIAIVSSTAFAVTMAANNICKHKEAGKILVLQDQYNSAVYGWQKVCETHKGYSLEVVPHPPRENDWTTCILERLDETVAVACLPPLHWSDGALLDLERITEACHSLNIDVVIDGTQAVGIMEVDVQKLKPKMLACSVHKWLRAPPGQCLVYIPSHVHELWDPLDQHGRTRDHGTSGDKWNTIPDEMGPNGYPEKFRKGACKFDSGGKPNPLLLTMLRGSLEEVVKIDFETAQASLCQLIKPLLQWAKDHDIDFPSRHASHLVGLRPRGLDPGHMVDMCAELASDGIYIAVRCGVFRVSPYLENTAGDIQRLISKLTELLEM